MSQLRNPNYLHDNWRAIISAEQAWVRGEHAASIHWPCTVHLQSMYSPLTDSHSTCYTDTSSLYSWWDALDLHSLKRFKAQEDDLRSLDSLDSGYHSTYKCDRLNITFDTINEEFSDSSVDDTSEYVNTEQEQQGACHLQTVSSSLIGGPDQEDNDSDNYSSDCSPDSGDKEPVVHLESSDSDSVEVCPEEPVDVSVHEQGAL